VIIQDNNKSMVRKCLRGLLVLNLSDFCRTCVGLCPTCVGLVSDLLVIKNCKCKLNQSFCGVSEYRIEGSRSVWADSTVWRNLDTGEYLDFLCLNLTAVLIKSPVEPNRLDYSEPKFIWGVPGPCRRS
jgi:hypothetical protein